MSSCLNHENSRVLSALQTFWFVFTWTAVSWWLGPGRFIFRSHATCLPHKVLSSVLALASTITALTQTETLSALEFTFKGLFASSGTGLKISFMHLLWTYSLWCESLDFHGTLSRALEGVRWGGSSGSDHSRGNDPFSLCLLVPMA